MKRNAHAEAEATIDAPAAEVYAVIADYRTHHPKIMPPSFFENLEVESGGIGTGTVFHITLRVPGRNKRLHMRVDEPDPGRVLTETNLDTGVVTEFEVTSADGASFARMSSTWATPGGLPGLAQRTMLPVLTRYIFRKQLAQLDRYMRSPGRARGEVR